MLATVRLDKDPRQTWCGTASSGTTFSYCQNQGWLSRCAAEDHSCSHQAFQDFVEWSHWRLCSKHHGLPKKQAHSWQPWDNMIEKLMGFTFCLNWQAPLWRHRHSYSAQERWELYLWLKLLKLLSVCHNANNCLTKKPLQSTSGKMLSTYWKLWSQ